MTYPSHTARRPDDPPHDDLPLITTIREARPLARRPHTCTVCGQPIAIGSRYSRTIVIDDEALSAKNRLKVIKWHLPYCPSEEAQS